MDVKLLSPSGGSSSAKGQRAPANFRTEEIRGYLFKKTRDGKWQKRWFETNGCFLTYYKKQGQKLLAALNLPQVGAIALLGEDSSDGPGLFTIELNERVYTIKARSQEEAAFWVDALLWRQAGGVVTQKSPAEMNKPAQPHGGPVPDKFDTRASAVNKAAPINPDDDLEPASQEQLKGGGCAPCCVLQ
ncbi:hypothetical protein PybrP1_009509 [[Pythium] brassicae (nom. inval.)]|nr:hypothetical protein PybrP1_009509 [[Pythium] brassicae (nom. inval.)]